jgi:hypothetical protein
MRNLGRHRVQLINPFDAAATLLQAAVRRLFAIINMPPEMIFDIISGVGGLHPQMHQRTHEAHELRETYRLNSFHYSLHSG